MTCTTAIPGGLGDALELDRPDRLQATWPRDVVGDWPTDQHLPWAGAGGQAGGDVDRRSVEDALEVADGVVEPDVLAVPPVDRQQRLLEQRWKLRTGHATGVQEVLLGRPGPAQGLLDLGLVQVGLGLGQPSQGIGIGAQEPQRHILVGVDGEQLLEQLDDDQIVFADVVGGACWGEAESVMQPSSAGLFTHHEPHANLTSSAARRSSRLPATVFMTTVPRPLRR